jgi:hypothetical protein
VEQAQQGRQPLPRLPQILLQPSRAAPPAEPRHPHRRRERGGPGGRLGRGGPDKRPQGIGVQQARLLRLGPPPRRLRTRAGPAPDVRCGGGDGWLRGGAERAVVGRGLRNAGGGVSRSGRPGDGRMKYGGFAGWTDGG